MGDLGQTNSQRSKLTKIIDTRQYQIHISDTTLYKSVVLESLDVFNIVNACTRIQDIKIHEIVLGIFLYLQRMCTQ